LCARTTRRERTILVIGRGSARRKPVETPRPFVAFSGGSRSCPARAINDRERIARNVVATPGDVLVRPNEHKVALINASRLGVRDIDHRQRNATCFCRLDKRGSATVAEAEQCEILPKAIKDRCSVFEKKMGRAYPRP